MFRIKYCRWYYWKQSHLPCLQLSRHWPANKNQRSQATLNLRSWRCQRRNFDFLEHCTIWRKIQCFSRASGFSRAGLAAWKLQTARAPPRPREEASCPTNGENAYRGCHLLDQQVTNLRLPPLTDSAEAPQVQVQVMQNISPDSSACGGGGAISRHTFLPRPQ